MEEKIIAERKQCTNPIAHQLEEQENSKTDNLITPEQFEELQKHQLQLQASLLNDIPGLPAEMASPNPLESLSSSSTSAVLQQGREASHDIMKEILEPVLKPQYNVTALNQLPIASEAKQSLCLSTVLHEMEATAPADTTKTKFIQEIKGNCPLLKVITTSTTTTQTIPIEILSTTQKTTSTSTIENNPTRKESESLTQQSIGIGGKNNNNSNNTINEHNQCMRNGNDECNNTKYDTRGEKEEIIGEKMKENISDDNGNMKKDFVQQKQQQQQAKKQSDNINYVVALLPSTTAAAETNIQSAVQRSQNESKSEECNDVSTYIKQQAKTDDDDEKSIDIDVITVSSTDENLIQIMDTPELMREKKMLHEQYERQLQQLTEKSLQNSMNLQRTHSKTESVLEYLNSVEPTVTEIQDKLIEFGNAATSSVGDNSSSIGSANLLNDSESEEDDQLKPLMQDNHTIVVNHEFYVYSDKYPNPSYNNEMMANNKQCRNVNYSSTDSDLSTQFDHRDVTTMSQNSSEDFNDSGLETISNQLKPPTAKQLQTIKGTGPIPPAPASTPVTGVPGTGNMPPEGMLASENSEVREIDTLLPSEIPDEKLCEEIVEAVEYYFSNENILKDAFLLKHVRRNKEGFVSLKLISSFKRVRQYTKDWRIVGNAIERRSKQIEMNDVGTKIRRLEPLPNFDETMPSRTIVVCDLPYEKLSIDKITDIFAKCGEIALVRILKPGMQIPVDVRQFMNKYPEMQQKECALVEFLDSASARFAKSMSGNYKVFDMVAPKKKTGKKSITTITKFIENYKYPDANYERTRGGIENVHHYSNYSNHQGHHHHHHHHSSNNHVLQTNNSNYDNEFKSKPRSIYDIRSSQQQQQQNQENQMQNFVYQPPHMQHRRFSSSDQENNNREHLQNMNNLNNQMGSQYGSNSGNIHFGHYPPRRLSNSSITDLQSRKYSSCSEGYSSTSEYSRRHSLASSQDSSSRKTSNCSEYCPCSRRSSQCSDAYRKISQTSDTVNSSPIRRFSNGSFHGFERQYNNQTDQPLLNGQTNLRRISFDSNYDRKMSASSINSNNNSSANQQQNNGQHICENHYRKYSNGFDPNRKLSFTDQYFNGRRISTDSGYDRKLSFSSDTGSTSTSPRSRANSFILPSQHKAAEILVRTPIGPDGSKGFASRARKMGQTVQSVN